MLGKCFENSIHFLRYFGSHLIHIDVSSANISLCETFWAYVIPSISFVLLFLISNNSTANMSTYGDATSPWETFYSSRIFLVSSPPRRM